MCYTCTFSLCKGCAKDAAILCVRGNKGFCEVCMKIVMLIEDGDQGNKVYKLSLINSPCQLWDMDQLLSPLTNTTRSP